MRTEILYDIPEDTYHADPCDTPALSQSLAHTLITSSPAHAYLEHPKLGGVARVPTSSMDLGSLVHSLLLGAGAKIHLVSANDWKTKAAQAERDEARAAGELPVLVKDMAEAHALVDVVRPKLLDRGIVLDGHSEVVVLWTEDTDAGVIQCRARMDHITGDEHTVIDLKTTGKILPPSRLGRHFCDFGYEIQAAAYVRAVEAARPHLCGRVRFLDVAIELTRPNCVTVAEPDGAMRALGERRWLRACETWGQCLATNTWPEYSDSVVLVSPPEYEIMREDAIAG